jgi:hypothetical protein
VYAAVAAWLAAADVLADPDQRYDGEVWTRAQEIFPGAEVVEGRPVVAAWGDATWTALPRWDDEELDTLWLQPLGPPRGVPTVDASLLVGALTAHLVRDLRSTGALTAAGMPADGEADDGGGRDSEGVDRDPTMRTGAPTGHQASRGRPTRPLEAVLEAATQEAVSDLAAAVAALTVAVAASRRMAREVLIALAESDLSPATELARTPAGQWLHRWARLPAPSG